MFHDAHIEITWSSTENGTITLIPPQPLALSESWNAVDFWVGGFPNDFKRPWMHCIFRLTDQNGQQEDVEICSAPAARRITGVDMFHRLLPRSICGKFQGGRLAGIELGLAASEQESALELYAICFYPYQAQRAYYRPKKLPFPTHPDGVVPTPSAAGKTSIECEASEGGQARFSYAAEDGSDVVYSYTPQTGTLEDVRVSVAGGPDFKPFAVGGVVFEIDGERMMPAYAALPKLLGQDLQNNRLDVRWQLESGKESIRYTLTLRMVRRSLVVEAAVEGQSAVELRIGYPDLVAEKRPIEVPMLTWDSWAPIPANDYEPADVVERKAGRARSPAVLVAGDLLLSAIFDWYVSDASLLYATAEVHGEAAGFDGGAYYLPVIDQGRNPLCEKLILTVARGFQEVLPNIPNPPSPYAALVQDRVYGQDSLDQVSAVRHKNLNIYAVFNVESHGAGGSERSGLAVRGDAGPMKDWADEPTRCDGGVARVVKLGRRFREIGWMVGSWTNYCMEAPGHRCFAEIPCVHDARGNHRSAWPGTMVPATGDTLPYLRRQSPKAACTGCFRV